LNVANNEPSMDALKKQVEENSQGEGQPINKNKVLQILADSFTALHQTIDGARASTLSRNIDLFGTSTTLRGVLIDIETHIAEHLGQAIAYARVNGIVPPWPAQ
jgi:hypothetical protein